MESYADLVSLVVPQNKILINLHPYERVMRILF